MRRLTMALLLALAAAAAPPPAAASFWNVDVSPRARAMGGAGAAIADDAFAAGLNPAGLALLPAPAVGASYVRPFGYAFSTLIYAGGVVPLGDRLGAVGVGLRRFGVEHEGVDLTTETTVTLAHGIRLYEDLHSSVRAGVGVNIYHLSFGATVNELDPGSDTAAGLDAGLMATLRGRTRLGVAVRNLNHPQIGVDREEIGQRLNGGIAYAPYEGVWTTFEFENRLEQDVIYRGGVELAGPGGLTLRAGAVTNPGKLTGGFGYARRGLAVAYAFSTGGGVLDSSHQFGLTFAWGGEEP